VKIALFLAVITVGLWFTIGSVAKQYGPDVSARFLERGDYSTRQLSDFIAGSPTNARGYAIPVLFPWDLLFMASLGGFLAFASVASAHSIEPLKAVAWLFAIGPVLYIAADLIEDLLLAHMLLSGQASATPR
jgi:hypothetical protein